MITFKLNGKTVQGEEGQYILQVAEKVGVEIPTLCHHKALEPAGMCRICTVELYDGRRTRFVTACNYPIWEGMEVKTDTEAVHAGRKLIVEMLLARCPEVPLLQDLAKQYAIEAPRFKLENDTCILCGLCTRMCEKMGSNAISLTGRGVDMKVDTPFHLQSDVCIACGACASVCPTGHITLEKIREVVSRRGSRLIPSEYDMGLKGRKPVYVPYAQAVPNTPAIDRDVCAHFKTGGCQVCTSFCGVDAIDHTMEDEIVELEVGSVILAPGFEPFDPSKFDAYNYANHPNVITSMEMERILLRLRPDGWPPGAAFRPQRAQKDRLVPVRGFSGPEPLRQFLLFFGVLHVRHQGSRYRQGAQPLTTWTAPFSSWTCAPPARSSSAFTKTPNKRVFASCAAGCTPSIRCRTPMTSSVRYVTEEGETITETFDQIVLSIGMEPIRKWWPWPTGWASNSPTGNFCKTDTFNPWKLPEQGIYVCGAFQGPKDIPQSVVDASAAASAAGEILAEARNTLTKSRKSSRKPTSSANGHASAYSSAAAASILPVWSMYRMSGIMPAACPMSSTFRTTSTPAPRIPRRP
jgi:heterodisulfide reductase subunit A